MIFILARFFKHEVFCKEGNFKYTFIQVSDCILRCNVETSGETQASNSKAAFDWLLSDRLKVKQFFKSFTGIYILQTHLAHYGRVLWNGAWRVSVRWLLRQVRHRLRSAHAGQSGAAPGRQQLLKIVASRLCCCSTAAGRSRQARQWLQRESEAKLTRGATHQCRELAGDPARESFAIQEAAEWCQPVFATLDCIFGRPKCARVAAPVQLVDGWPRVHQVSPEADRLIHGLRGQEVSSEVLCVLPV